MEELVSIIISSYNHEKFIQETLLSAVKQTYKNIELIVIDDGSKDKTYEKILEIEPILRKRFVRTYIEKHENIGAAKNGNQLVKRAKGKYFYPIASDDVLCPNAVEVCVDVMSKHPEFGIVAGDSYFLDQDSNVVCMDENRNIVSESSFYSYKTYTDYSKLLLLHYYGKKIGNRYDYTKVEYLEYRDFWFDNTIPVNYLIRADVYKKIEQFSVNSPLEDMFFHLQLSKYYKIKVLPEVLSYYRLHPKNTMKRKKYVEKVAEMTRFYELYLLDTKYPEFKTEDLKDSWWYVKHLDEWEASKKSPYWDENYYTNKYPEIKEKGYIPLVHYISYGKREGYLPSKIFESKLYHITKGKNLLLNQENILIYLFRRIKRRLLSLFYSLLVFITLIPIINFFTKKYRKKFLSLLNSNIKKNF